MTNPKTLPLLVLLFALSANGEGIPIATPSTGETEGFSSPAMASNGNGFLATWNADRGGAVGASFDAGGRLISPPFGLSDFCGGPLAFGESYLLNCRNPRTGVSAIRKVDAAGQETGIIKFSPSGRSYRAFASSDDRILVLDSSDSEFRVLDAAGTPIGDPIQLNPADFGRIRTAESIGSDFYLVTDPPSNTRRMKVLKISRDGRMIWAAAIAFEGMAFSATAVSTVVNDKILVAVTDLPGTTISTASIDRDRNVIAQSFPTSRFMILDIVASGADGAVLFGGRASGTVTLAWNLRSDGATIGVPVTIATDPLIVAVASNQSHILALARTDYPQHLLGARLDSKTLLPSAVEDLSIGPQPQYSVRVAASAATAIATWIEPGLVRARRIVDGQPFGEVIEVAQSASGLNNPQVAAGRTSFLIAWNHNAALFARRLSLEGDLLDSTPLTIATPSPSPHYETTAVRLASDGERFFAVQIRDRQLTAVVISADGVTGPRRVIGETLAPAGGTRWESRSGLALTWAGDRYVLVWSHDFWSAAAGRVESSELRTMELDREGVPIPGTSHLLGRNLRAPQVAHGGGFSLITARDDSANHALLIANGSIVARHDLSLDMPGFVTEPAVAWDGREFVVVFRKEDILHLWRIPIHGTPRSSRARGLKVFEGHSVPPVLAISENKVLIIVDEWRSVDRLPTTFRSMLYDDDDLEPWGPRRRAAAR